MKPFYITKFSVLVLILLGWNMGSSAQTVTFTNTASLSVYTVPAGVTAIGIDMAGAQGGTSYPGSPGGKGGRVQCNIQVAPAQVFSVYVGAVGANYNYSISNGGTNCGGGAQGGYGYYYGAGGGGSSDIRTGGVALTNRVVVAGGGGGGGYNCYSSTGEKGGDGGGTTGAGGWECSTQSTCLCGQGGTQTVGGAPANCYYGNSIPYAGGFGIGGQQTSYLYSGGGGGGYYGGGCAAYGGGGGGSSFAPSTATNVTHTQGSQSSNGYVTICAPSLGNVTGNAPVCVGSTLTLGETVSGGTWSSSNIGVASVGSSTGVVTGVTAGTATLTYSIVTASCGAGYTTVQVTINPAPAAIAGAATTCPGLTSTLTDAVGGGTWTTSAPSVALIGSSSGIVSGLSVGNPIMTYTLPTGCYSAFPMTVNPLPLAITGTAAVCAAGSTTTLSDLSPSGTWSSSAPGIASVIGGSGVVTGIAAGTSVITYMIPTGCYTTTILTVNPLPAPITGVVPVCVNSTVTAADATSGGTWSTSNPGMAAVTPSSGTFTGVSVGNPYLTYTLPTGCYATFPLTVNQLPSPISGILSSCAGGSTTLSDATPGGTWTSSNPSYASVLPTSGAVTGVSAGLANISYTLSGTGCYVTVPYLVNALPTVYTITGGGGYCAGSVGSHVGLSYSNSGINYKLYNGATLVTTMSGLNAALDFGLQTATGSYTAVAINPATGCISNMLGSTSVSVNTLPNVYSVSGGGSFCAGGAGAHVTLGNSEIGVSYQLMVGTTPVGGLVPGIGASLDFGAQTTAGTYTVVATNLATGCTSNMSGSATISVNPLPTMYVLNAGGGYCVGGTGIDVVLSGSDAVVNYQMFYNGVASGSAMPGTGAPLHFGLHTAAGIYTVSGINTVTGCASNMSGSTTITINPLPNVYTVTGGGSFCAGGGGVHVGLNYSDAGINYQLLRGGSPAGPAMPGSSAGLDFGLQTIAGTYTVVATDAVTGCTKNMTGSATVSTTTLPSVYTVTGGGGYCAGGAGVHVGLAGSNVGILYQLYYSGSPLGSPMSGTGGALDFGIHNGIGVYTVVATNMATSCSNNMSGSAIISVNTLPTAYTVSGSGTSYCAGGSGIDITLSGSDGGINYQLYKGSSLIGTAMPGSGGIIDFGPQMAAGIYTVVATNTTSGCTSTMSGSASVAVDPVPAVFTVTGGGSYCPGGVGVHVGLSGSASGVTYQLLNGGIPVGTTSGLGSSIDFGYQTASGNYTVVAMDAITGCTSNMSSSATVAVNALPNVYTVMGGGNYCLGTGGVDVNMDGSDVGISYQLVLGTTLSGSPMTGGGSTVDFGNRTTAGTYTVIATDPSTMCTNTMAGSAIVGINPLPSVYNVTGGGTYCVPGGTGVNVNLNNSDINVNYQLFYMGTPLGGTVAGTGSSINFGLVLGVGSYNVVATDAVTTCQTNMSGTATVATNPAPNVDSVIGGGNYCSGGTGRTIGLNTTDMGINYQLYLGITPVGSAVAGTGAAINFGLKTTAGVYTVVASPGGVCATTMFGSAMITIDPLPTVHLLTGGGSYCNSGTGVDVGLDGSDAGVKYQLYMGTSTVGSPVAGTGSALDFGNQTTVGTYTVIGTDSSTNCSTPSGTGGSVAISILPLPATHNVTGGGAYCAGGPGSHVTLDGSNTNVNYQLYRNGSSLGATYLRAGTGTIIDFGPQATAGGYTVRATDAATNCTNNMIDTAMVSINPILTPTVNVTAHPGLNIVSGQRDTLVATATGTGTATPSYQWYVNGFQITGATNNKYISHSFADKDSVTCMVMSNGDCGGVTSAYSVKLHVRDITGVAQVQEADINVSVVPNPNKGSFVIEGTIGSDDQEAMIEVTDMVGHTVYSGKASVRGGNISERVQLNNVANGMYILGLRSASGSKVFHIVVEQ